MENRTKVKTMYVWAIGLVLLGLILNYLDIGENTFFTTYNSVGNWLVYIGFISVIIAVVRTFTFNKRKIDERMEFIAAKSLRVTFLCTIIGAFVIIVIDGIHRITLPYHLFMSYAVCALILVHFITYNIMIRKN